MKAQKEHYSYRVYSDPSVARTFDSERFGGPIGALIKEFQESAVFRLLPDVRGWKVLDLGAGTGRFTLPFLERGAHVTACDASAEMLEVLKQKAGSTSLSVMVADAHHLEFADRSFDCAMSFRMLMHVVDPQKALSELCRVSNDRVIFDVPPAHGFLSFAPLLHGIRRVFSRNYQSYRIFSLRKLRQELQRNGFEIVATDFGFFLPLIFHRLVKSTGFTRKSEQLFRGTGLTKIAGGPVTIFARRKK
jgi:ubiquinone/menaquinone biosynthesis C-methylase UbiE